MCVTCHVYNVYHLCHVYHVCRVYHAYGVASISRLLKMKGLFCKRALSIITDTPYHVYHVCHVCHVDHVYHVSLRLPLQAAYATSICCVLVLYDECH